MAEIRGELTEYPETGGRLKEDEWPPEKLEPEHGHRYNTVFRLCVIYVELQRTFTKFYIA